MAGAAQQPEAPASDPNSCSVSNVGENGSSLAWLAVAGAFSGLALARTRRRRNRAL
jgi:hypothetical protein